jgi:hypothetical protein
VNAFSHRIREFRAFLESLHPTPILLPIAQGQQLGVESQANSQAPRGMNNHGRKPQEVVQNTRTVPGENIGTFVSMIIYVRRVRTRPGSTSTRWISVSAA